MDNSFTRSYITQVSGTTLPEYHKEYLQSAREISKLQMIAEMYFPALAPTANRLAGEANLFWGSQQGMLWFASKSNVDLEQKERDKVLAASQKIATSVSEAKTELTKIAHHLQLPFTELTSSESVSEG